MQINETNGSKLFRPGSSYYDPRTLTGLVNKARDSFRGETLDCPILPVLCFDDNGVFSLSLTCLTAEPHFIEMSCVDMYIPGFYENEETFELVENIGPNQKYHGIELSGETRKFQKFERIHIFNRNIQLPIDKARAGELKVNIRMQVDRKSDRMELSIINVNFAPKELEIIS